MDIFEEPDYQPDINENLANSDDSEVAGQEAEPQSAEPDTSQESTQEVKAPEEKPQEDRRMVPLEALHEARMQNRELRDQMNQLNAKFEQFSNLKNDLEAFRAKEAQKFEEDKFEEDPIGTLKNEIDEIKNLTSKQAEIEQQRLKQQEEIRSIIQEVTSYEQEFISEKKDYYDALNFYREQRLSDLKLMGYDQKSASELLANEELIIAKECLQRGQNPAEIAYNLSKQRGYAAKQHTTPAEQKIEQVSKGQQAAKSLSGTGGRREDSGMSLSDIERMSDDDFDKLWADMERTAR